MTNIETLELLRLVREGREDAFDALAREYRKLIESTARRAVRSVAESGFPEGELTLDDLRQEARLAFYRAAMSYDADGVGKEVTFGLYAKVCMRNAMISELRRASSRRRRAERARLDIASVPDLPETSEDGIDMRARRMLTSVLRESDELLSSYEKRVFDLYVTGRSACEIASELGVEPKSVSNALYRIRVKLRVRLKGLSDD